MNQVKAGAILNYAIIVLNIAVGLLYTPFMLRSLGQTEYGLYSLVASVIAYLTLLDFGFGSAMVRYTAKIRATGTQRDEWSLYGMFMSAYTIIGVFIAIAGFVLYLNTDRMFDRTMSAYELQQARIMMGLMVFNLAVTFPFSTYGSIITAYEKFIFLRVITLIRIVLMTAIMIAILTIGYKAVALVIVQTVFSVLSLALNWWYCKYRLRVKFIFERPDRKLLREVMVFSFWNFVGAISDRIYWGTGQFVLGIYSGPVAVAIFSLALTLMNLYMTMSTSFNSVLLPRITALATSRDNDRAISDLFIRTGRLQFCVLALIFCGFVVIGQPFIQLWAGDGYDDSYVITLIFYAALICPLIQNVGITILLARGQQKFRSLCYLGISLVSLGVQVLVTRRYGAVGCAWVVGLTLVAGQWIVMNIYYHIRQRLNIMDFWRQILRMSIAPAVLTALAYVAVKHYHIVSWSQLVLCGTAFVALYLPLFYKLSMNGYERDIITVPLKRITSKIMHR